MRKQGIILKQKPGATFLGGERDAACGIPPGVAAKSDLARVGLFQPGQQAEQGGFPGAGRTEKHGHGVLIERDAEVGV